MTKKISIIIPTLQKNIDFLNQLVTSLVADDAVGEIIIIDNSTNGYNYDNPKVKPFIPEENMFVNPSWNKGVELAENDYIGILNDDICIPNGFCSKIINDISEDIGIIGTNGYSMINKFYEPESITDSSYRLEETPYMTYNYGVMLFFHKNNYHKIPEDLTIYYGDDYLFFKNKKSKKKNYVIEDLKMYHYGSLSSGAFSKLIKKENSLFNKYTLTIWDRFFSIERKRTKLVIRLFFITLGIQVQDKRHANRIDIANGGK